ncbi:MAG: glycosyl hydrolase family 18 protein [Oscillospiraceae bacterium]
MRQAVLYFANWNLNRRPARKGEVCALPWDCATYLNHAFWVLEPSEGTQETSFARRAGKKPARTDWRQRSRVERRAGKKAVQCMLAQGVAPGTICIGSPFYCTAMRLREKPESVQAALGAPVEPERPTWDTLVQEDLLELLQTPGWHSAYDARAGGAYLIYDGPDNPFDRWFLSVETARSLGQKLDLIRNAELAGIIVWEANLDTKNHSFAAQLRDTLLR